MSSEIERLRQRMADEPNSTAFVPLAEALRRARRLDEALTVLREGLRHHPDFVPARVTLARIHIERGHPVPATEILEDVLRTDPVNLAAVVLLAKIYLESGQHRRAEPLISRARQLAPGDPRLNELMALQRPEPDFRHLRGEDSFASAQVAMFCEARGHLERALGIWQQILARYPDHSEILDRIRRLQQELNGQDVGAPHPLPPLPGRREVEDALMALEEDRSPRRVRA